MGRRRMVTVTDRVMISTGLKAGWSIRVIAAANQARGGSVPHTVSVRSLVLAMRVFIGQQTYERAMQAAVEAVSAPPLVLQSRSFGSMRSARRCAYRADCSMDLRALVS